MVRDHRGHQLAVGAGFLCAIALAVALVAWLGRGLGAGAGGGPAASGAASGDGGASIQTGEKFSSGEEGGEGLLDSAFDLVGLEGRAAARSWEATSLEEGASQLLDQYAQQDACALARSGYLDLQGRVWGCVVTGRGWADICVVKESASDGTAQVFCWRIDQDSAARAIGE